MVNRPPLSVSATNAARGGADADANAGASGPPPRPTASTRHRWGTGRPGEGRSQVKGACHSGHVVTHPSRRWGLAPLAKRWPRWERRGRTVGEGGASVAAHGGARGRLAAAAAATGGSGRRCEDGGQRSRNTLALLPLRPTGPGPHAAPRRLCRAHRRRDHPLSGHALVGLDGERGTGHGRSRPAPTLWMRWPRRARRGQRTPPPPLRAIPPHGDHQPRRHARPRLSPLAPPPPRPPPRPPWPPRRPPPSMSAANGHRARRWPAFPPPLAGESGSRRGAQTPREWSVGWEVARAHAVAQTRSAPPRPRPPWEAARGWAAASAAATAARWGEGCAGPARSGCRPRPCTPLATRVSRLAARRRLPGRRDSCARRPLLCS